MTLQRILEHYIKINGNKDIPIHFQPRKLKKKAKRSYKKFSNQQLIEELKYFIIQQHQHYPKTAIKRRNWDGKAIEIIVKKKYNLC